MSEVIARQTAETQIPAEIAEHCLDYMYSGSRIICNPPVTDTDSDIVLLLTEEKCFQAISIFQALGFVLPERLGTEEGHEQYQIEMAEIKKYRTAGNPTYLQFFTMRRGKINIIVMCCPVLFKRWWQATVWATTLNLQSKKDRRDFFMLVKYGPESCKNGSVL